MRLRQFLAQWPVFHPVFGNDALRAATKGGWALGTAHFSKQIKEATRRRAVPRSPGRLRKYPRSRIMQQRRAEAPRAFSTLATVANSGLPSGDSAL
jgi:hypothetical protein